MPNDTSGITLEELFIHPPPPVQWMIPRLLPEGALVFAGPPKIGKSFLSLQLCTDITTGAITLGKFTTNQGRIHYFGLEDNLRRFYDRTLKQGLDLSNAHLLHLHIATMPGQQTVDQCRAILERYKDTSIIVIDTMERVRDNKAGRTQYSEDYDFVGVYQQLALEFHVVIILVHHTKKAPGETQLDAISGTRGIIAAAENLWILEKSPNPNYYATLHVEGKGVDSFDYSLDFNKDTCTWEILDELEGPALPENRQDILDLLREKGILSTKDICDMITLNANGHGGDIKPATIRKNLSRMKEAGQIFQPKTGYYGPPEGV